MSVGTCFRTNQDTSSLDAIFNVITSQPQSTMIVKKIMAIAISQITYLRAICRPDAYLEKTLDDLNLKILKESSTCKRSCLVIKWMRGCFEALEKKYLRQIIFGVHEDPNKHDNLIESYKFCFNYVDNIQQGDGSINDTAKANVTFKSSTLSLLRNLLLFFKNLYPLPPDSRMVMKLLYYDDVTPDGYNPPGFIVSSVDRFTYSDEVVDIRFGQLSTGFHTVKLGMNCSKKLLCVNGQEEVKLNDHGDGGTAKVSRECDDSVKPLTSPDSSMDTDVASEHISPKESESSLEVASQISFSNVSNVLSSLSTPDSNNGQTSVEQISNTDNLTAVQNIEMKDDHSFGIKCACGFNKDDDLMVLCVKCNFWQHAVCYKILKMDDVPQIFICVFCAKLFNFNGFDPTLTPFSNSELKVACLWRRIVFACSAVRSLTVNWICDRLEVDYNLAQIICDKLLEMKCITNCKRNRNKFKVDSKFVKNSVLPRYFSTNSSNLTSFDFNLNKLEVSSKSKQDLLVETAEVERPTNVNSVQIAPNVDYKKPAFVSTRKRKQSFQTNELFGNNHEFESSSPSQDSQSKKYKASITGESLQY